MGEFWDILSSYRETTVIFTGKTIHSTVDEARADCMLRLVQ